MHPVQASNTQLAITQVSQGPTLIDLQISEARRNASRLPIGNLIHHADMWFNLQGAPQVTIQLSPTLKQQLLHAVNSYLGPDLTPVMAGFTVDQLSVPDLVLLYRILNSYQIEFPTPVLHVHLDMIKNKLFEICKDDPIVEEDVMTAIKNNNDLYLKSLKKFLLLHLHPSQEITPSDVNRFSAGSVFGLDIMLRIFDHLNPESQGTARRVCKTWYYFMENSFFLQSHQKRLLEFPIFSQRGFRNLYSSSVFPRDVAIKIADSLMKRSLPRLSPQDQIKPLLVTSSSEIRRLESLKNIQECNDLINFCMLLPEEVRDTLPSVYANNLTLRQKAFYLRTELRNSWAVRNLQKLDLSRKGLHNLLPEISFFSSLQELDVTNNHLTTLPNEIGSLRNLKTLFAWSNQLTSLPAEIGFLQNLTLINVCYNQLSTLPDEIRFLQNLVILNVSDNPLTILPDNIRFLQKLKELIVCNNELAILPDWIGSLQNLTDLNVAINQLRDLPDAIGSLINLTSLNVPENHLTTLPDAIGSLVNLRWLGVSRNRLATLPDAIGSLPKLTTLRIAGNTDLILPPSLENPRDGLSIAR